MRYLFRRVLPSLLGAGVILLSVACGGPDREAQIARFAPFLSEYTFRPEYKKEVFGVEPRIAGKVVTIGSGKFKPRRLECCPDEVSVEVLETDATWVDDIYFYLPEESRAKTPEEVGTIIHLAYSGDVVGSYANVGAAIQVICMVSIIDPAQNTIVSQRLFSGKKPESDLIYSPGASGLKQVGDFSPAGKDILKFITRALPRS
jgi:hypothetical protein